MSKYCVVCKEAKSKLCPLSGNKASKSNYIGKIIQIVGLTLDTEILNACVVCSTCST